MKDRPAAVYSLSSPSPSQSSKCKIVSWLSSVSPVSEGKRGRKRYRESESPSRAPSPPPSSSSPGEYSSRTKRQRVATTEQLVGAQSQPDEATRRPRRRRAEPADLSPATSSKRSRSSVASSRTSSPTKFASLSRMPFPIRHEVIVTSDFYDPQLPSDFASLLSQMDDIVGGIGVVPQHLANAVAEEQRRKWNQNFVAVDAPASLVSQEDVDALVKISRECERRGFSEAMWNCAVHYELGKLALRQAGLVQDLLFANITTAHVLSSDLPLYFQSKAVDFAIILRLPEEKVGLSRLLVFNHLNYPPIADMPVAVHIETKVTGEGDQAGLTQMATCLLAQFNRLRSLTQDARSDNPSSLPSLPFFLVQGQVWQFGSASYFEDHVKLWRCGIVGESNSRLGVCRILAALQVLMNWAHTQYRLWFERNVLRAPSETLQE